MVTCKFDDLQSTKNSLLQYEDDNGDDKVPLNKTVQIDEQAHCRAEQGPVQYRETLDHKDPELRLARWNHGLPGEVKVLLPLVEGAQPLFLLLPPLVAPELEVLLGRGEGVYGVAVDVEVDLFGKVPVEQVPLCLRDVVRVGHRDVVDSVEVLS